MSGNDHVIGNTAHDDTIAAVLETAKALAPPRVKAFRIFGVEIKADINLNTILAMLSLLGVLSGAVYSALTLVTVPKANSAEIAQIRSEIGRPGQPDYVPGSVKGLKRRIDSLEKTVEQNHNDTLLALGQIQMAIRDQGKDNATRFDRLDVRIDRLVESQDRRRRD